MRCLLRAACVVALLVPSATVAQGNRWLAALEARAHVGETVTVCDSVAAARFVPSSPGQPTFLDLGSPFPNPSLTIVIWGAQRARFPTPPEQLYRDRRICVTGRVILYRDRPQIVVEQPTAIKFAASVNPPRSGWTRGGVRVSHRDAAVVVATSG